MDIHCITEFKRMQAFCESHLVTNIAIYILLSSELLVQANDFKILF